MAQQINLCTPILLKPKRYFSAQTMAITLGVFVVLGGALCGVWVWNLQQATTAFQQSMAAQERELEGLKTALRDAAARPTTTDPVLTAQLQALRTTLGQRAQLREALRQGLFEPGLGHSDRLALVARTLPPHAWVTDIRLDQGRFEVQGYTLETGALNAWVDRLAAEPLTQGMRLSTVKVENVPPPAALLPASAASAATALAAPARPVWSFLLVSVTPAKAAASAASAPGGRT